MRSSPSAALAPLALVVAIAWPLAGCGARTLGLDDPSLHPTDGASDGDAGHDSSSDSGSFDSSFDSAFDSGSFDSASFDSATVDTAFDAPDGPNGGYTVGGKCQSDFECPGGSANPPQCSPSLLPGYATPVCIEYGCDPQGGTSAVACGDGTGWCLPTSNAPGDPGVCLPACGFDERGGWQGTCAGNNGCTVYSYQFGVDGLIDGLGVCLPGCRSDAECAGSQSGDRCQIETGYCVGAKTTYPLKLGARCTDNDYNAGNCYCLYWLSGGTTGYCSQVCRMGEAGACPSGFTCDALLPALDPTTGTAMFSAAPSGLLGYCLKDCSTDAECAAINGYCEQNAGTGRKTCQLGARP